MAQKDSSEKILESYNDVFSDIVNVLLFHGRQVLSADELEDQAPRSYYKADGQRMRSSGTWQALEEWQHPGRLHRFENQTASEPKYAAAGHRLRRRGISGAAAQRQRKSLPRRDAGALFRR